jgi:hypothetical protein
LGKHSTYTLPPHYRIIALFNPSVEVRRIAIKFHSLPRIDQSYAFPADIAKVTVLNNPTDKVGLVVPPKDDMVEFPRENRNIARLYETL